MFLKPSTWKNYSMNKRKKICAGSGLPEITLSKNLTAMSDIEFHKVLEAYWDYKHPIIPHEVLPVKHPGRPKQLKKNQSVTINRKHFNTIRSCVLYLFSVKGEKLTFKEALYWSKIIMPNTKFNRDAFKSYRWYFNHYVKNKETK